VYSILATVWTIGITNPVREKRFFSLSLFFFNVHDSVHRNNIVVYNIVIYDLSVLWVAYATHNTLKPVPTLPR
jgi:hypothetical protein